MKKIFIFTISFLTIVSLKAQDICSNLETAYTFNNVLTNVFNTDAFGGSSVYAPGQAGQCVLTADGSPRSATIPSLPIGNRPRTVALWVQANGNASGAKEIFRYGSNASAQRFGAYYDVITGQLSFNGFGTGNDEVIDGFFVQQGTWFHLAITYDGSDVAVYKNGVLMEQFAKVLNTGASTPFVLTGTAYTDDLRIYSRALSVTDIVELYNSIESNCINQPKDICSGLVTAYTFDRTGSNLNGTDAFSAAHTFVANSAAGGTSYSIPSITATITNIPVSNSERTISMWFKLPSGNAGTHNIFHYGSNTTAGRFGAYLNVSNGELTFQGYGSGQDEIVNNILINSTTSWYNLVFSYKGSTVKVYVNGTFREQFERNLNTGTALLFTLGSSSTLLDFDDLRIFNRELSTLEVYDLYQKPQFACGIDSEGECDGLKTAYTFNNNTANYNGEMPFTEVSSNTITFQPGVASEAMVSIYGQSYVAPNDFLPTGNSPRTVSLWFNNTGTSGTLNIFKYGTNATASLFGMYFNASNGNVTFQGFGGTIDEDINGATLIEPLTWTNITIVYTGKLIQFYVNGVFKEGFQRTLSTGNTLPFTLAGCEGLIDDLRVYGRALSQEDVLEVYNNYEPACSITTSISKAVDQEIGFKLYPNPANNQFNINGISSESNVELIDLTGKLLVTQKAMGNTITISTENINNGVYFVRISSKGVVSTQKVVISK
jgi:hypothetical protein